ncbi:DUF302 domain-containing protein [Vibrio gallicus]|uniref:DUF302 domain-containing protein n=1 Tax=Vibrio gallicus TaxID=190897 RepID=UPI0021C43EBB|nr:DUF302 domain-containing protein [Vibrio gallicus]
MIKLIAGALLSLSFTTLAFADVSGLIQVKSQYDVATTANNLQNVLTDKGMNIFARIDHAKGAQGVDIALRPTQLFIFGNPKVGSPLMKCEQTVAIDLPQKALIYQDAQGDVWLSYNDPSYLVERHNIQGCDKVIGKVSNALAAFAKLATGN